MISGVGNAFQPIFRASEIGIVMPHVSYKVIYLRVRVTVISCYNPIIHCVLCATE